MLASQVGDPVCGWSLRLSAVLWAVLVALPASAEGLLLVTDNAVAQFRQTVDGVKQVLPEVPSVDLSEKDALARIQAGRPDVVIAVGGRAAALVKGGVGAAPIVYATVLYPESKGLSGPQITGVPMDVPAASVLQKLKALAPKVKRVGVLYDPASAGSLVKAAEGSATHLGLSLVARPVQDSQQVRPAAEQLLGDVDALWLLPDPKVMSQEVVTFLLLLTVERRVAAIGYGESMTTLGTLASLSPDFADIGRKAAQMAKEIFQRKPAERVPVPSAVYSPGALSINLRTAAQLGLTPPPELISEARKVIR